MLCCPEDVTCHSHKKRRHLPSNICKDCLAPMCSECAHHIEDAHRDKMPPCALTNDLMIYYGLEALYVHDVIVLEMICASVCLTSMITFTLEKISKP